MTSPTPRTYNASGLKRALRSLEQNYGMTSDEFYNASEADDTERLRHIPRFTQHTWRSLYIERATGDR